MLLKYDEELYEVSLQVFNAFPLVGVVRGQYLCMHGGISPSLKDFADLEIVDRFVEVPAHGLFCDLLWADPVRDQLAEQRRFTKNNLRSCSVKFGYEPLKKLLKRTKTSMMLRGHQV